MIPNEQLYGDLPSASSKVAVRRMKVILYDIKKEKYQNWLWDKNCMEEELLEERGYRMLIHD